jgi:hypothetical protein
LTFEFKVNPSITRNVGANLTIIGNESGGSITIPVNVLAEPLEGISESGNIGY